MSRTIPDDPEVGFLPEDHAFTAELLRRYMNNDDQSLFHAVCSNNLNIILAALDHAAEGINLDEPIDPQELEYEMREPHPRDDP
jgi:hypothetical protein